MSKSGGRCRIAVVVIAISATGKRPIEHLVNDEVVELIKILELDALDLSFAFLGHEHLVGKLVDEVECLATFMPHQTDGAVIHHPVQRHQVLVLRVLITAKVIGQVRLQFLSLLVDVTEINEET